MPPIVLTAVFGPRILPWQALARGEDPDAPANQTGSLITDQGPSSGQPVAQIFLTLQGLTDLVDVVMPDEYPQALPALATGGVVLVRGLIEGTVGGAPVVRARSLCAVRPPALNGMGGGDVGILGSGVGLSDLTEA